jgi:hypothetical protein
MVVVLAVRMARQTRQADKQDSLVGQVVEANQKLRLVRVLVRPDKAAQVVLAKVRLILTQFVVEVAVVLAVPVLLEPWPLLALVGLDQPQPLLVRHWYLLAVVEQVAGHLALLSRLVVVALAVEARVVASRCPRLELLAQLILVAAVVEVALPQPELPMVVTAVLVVWLFVG